MTDEERLEQELTLAMRRVDAPAGFAERTLARARQLEDEHPAAKVYARQSSRRAWSGWMTWASGAVAAALLGGVFVAEQIHVRHQREQAALVEQQFEAGIRITDQALDHARAQLQRAGIELGD